VSRRTVPVTSPETGNGLRALSRARKWLGTHTPLGIVRRTIARRYQDSEETIAASTPQGFEVIELTRLGLHAWLEHSKQLVSGHRSDRRRALEALLDALAVLVDVTGDLRTGIARAGHANLAKSIGVSERSISRYINEILIPLGIISPVSVAYFDLSHKSEGQGQVPAYLLIQPAKAVVEAEPVDKTGDLNRNEYIWFKENPIFGKICPKTALSVDEIIENGAFFLTLKLRERLWFLRRIPDEEIAALLVPFVRIGDTVADLIHRIEWTKSGQKHQYQTQISHPLGWLRYRLTNWLNFDGNAMPTPIEQRENTRREQTALPKCPEHHQPIRPATQNGNGGCSDCRIDHQAQMHNTPSTASCALCRGPAVRQTEKIQIITKTPSSHT